MLLTECQRYLGASGDDGLGPARFACNKTIGDRDQLGCDLGPAAGWCGAFLLHKLNPLRWTGQHHPAQWF